MRRGLYFVLMVVLVLRGLAGTAMAAGVLPPFLTHAMGQQHQGHQHPHDGLHEHPELLDTAAVVAAGLEAGDLTHDTPHNKHHSEQAPHLACTVVDCGAHGTHSTTCSACEICHSAMLDTPARLTLAHAPARNSLPLAAAPFDSAPPALVIKPPIA